MTEQDFDEWLTDFCDSFPDTATWLGNSANQTATLERWRTVFEKKRISLEAGRRATAAMLAGEVESVTSWNREQIPALIVRACRELGMRSGAVSKSEAELAENMELAKKRRSGSSGGNMWEQSLGRDSWSIVEDMISMRKRGVSEIEINKFLDDEIYKRWPESGGSEGKERAVND